MFTKLEHSKSLSLQGLRFEVKDLKLASAGRCRAPGIKNVISIRNLKGTTLKLGKFSVVLKGDIIDNLKATPVMRHTDSAYPGESLDEESNCDTISCSTDEYLEEASPAMSISP